ncbi:MAG: hypothetical protein QM594_05855 [Niabella sp.]
MKLYTLKTFTGLPVMLLFIFQNCSSDKDGYTPPEPVIQVKLANSPALGSYLTDKDGRTLYYFANDSVTVNTCKGGCAALWPIFFAGINTQTIGEGLDINDFDTIGTGATQQLAYKGRPLYYYAPATGGVNTPEAAGQILGENVGGNWFVAKPDYTIMITNAQLVGQDGNNYIFDTLAATATPDYAVGNGKSRYFTDALGRALYIFRNDRLNKNNCTGGCATTWPVYIMDKIVVPSALDKTLFGAIDIAGGKQMTYKGWPLYYYAGDNMTMGLTRGVSVPQSDVWPIATRGLKTAPAP